MGGKINDMALDAMAPTTLNTSSISWTAAAIAITMAKSMIVYTINNILACCFRFTLSSVWMYELIY